MKCRICGCDTPLGSKLCKDCAAARKRAFAATVTQPLLLAAVGAPSVSHPRFAPKPGRAQRKPSAASAQHAAPKAAVEQSKATVRRAAATRRPGMLVLLVAISAAIAIVLAIMLAVRGAQVPAATDEPQPPAPAAQPQPEPVMAPAVVPAPKVRVETVPEVVIPKPLHPRTRKSAPPVPVVEPPPTQAAPAAPAEPPPRAAPPPPRLAEPVRTDPLQSLNEALKRCAREAMFDRPGCEQVARAKYCGASWGTIPQCPIGPGTDHGQ
jgi:hypothetical protein